MTTSIVSNGAGFNYYFVIVGHADNPVYELEYTTKGEKSSSIGSSSSSSGSSSSSVTTTVDHRYLSQFIAHAALDLVDEYIWTTRNMFLGMVDKFNEWHVVSFVGASSRTKFLLVHDATKIDESSLKTFFTELYDLYCKFSLNPLYEHHTPIRSAVFDKKAQILAKKYLP